MYQYPHFHQLRHRMATVFCGFLAASLCACSAASSSPASGTPQAEDTPLMDDSLYVLQDDSTVLTGQGGTVAFVADTDGVETGPDASLWSGMQAFSDTFGYNAQLYQAEEDSLESRQNALRTAAESGSAMVVCRGDEMAAALYSVQNEYPSVSFLIFDGEPHTEDYTAYQTASNTSCIMFNEEQAGYLAGYAAVMEERTRLGFVGSEAMPGMVRYCTGFLQGVDAAAQSQGVQASMEVWFVGSENAGDIVTQRMAEWYAEGVQAVMAAGEGTLQSCIDAAQGTGAVVIGTDWDCTATSDLVLTSAMKNYSSEVQNALFEYFKAGGWGTNGGTTVRVGASENAVGLPQVNWRMTEFTQREYEKVYNDLHDSVTKVERLSDISTLPETPNVAVDILG